MTAPAGAAAAGEATALAGGVDVEGIPVRRNSYARSALPIAALSAALLSFSGNPIPVRAATPSAVTNCELFGAGVEGAAAAVGAGVENAADGVAAAGVGAGAATGAAAGAAAGAGAGTGFCC